MITVGDLQQVLARSARRGMGGVVPIGAASFIDTDTGRPVIEYGNGTYLDAASGQVIDQNGRPLANIATHFGNPTAAAPGYVSPSSSGPSLDDITKLALTGAQIGGAIFNAARGVQPAAYQPPAPPMSTGAKAGIALGGLALLGGGLYAAGVFDKKPRRRRR